HEVAEPEKVPFEKLPRKIRTAPQVAASGLASVRPASVKQRLPMKRTLLAVGVAVLASMTFAPHSTICGWDIWGNEWVSYWWVLFPVCAKTDYVLWLNFYAQTAFVAVLAAVLVNLRRSKKADKEKSSRANTFEVESNRA